MSAELSDFAICRILKALDARRFSPTGTETWWASAANKRWSVICRLYLDIEPAPPFDYLRSAEFTLALKDYDANAIFAHGKPLVFKACPRLLGAKLVEGFQRLLDRPLFLDVTAVVSCPWRPYLRIRPTDVWPDVYAGYLPCYACTTANSLVTEQLQGLRRIRSWTALREAGAAMENYVFQADIEGSRTSRTETLVVEKFHIRSKNFVNTLTVEFHFRLTDGWRDTDRLPILEAASDEKKSWLEKVVFRVEDVTCHAHGASEVNRAKARQPTAIVRLPELALDVYGFVDRLYAGTSLVANRGLYEIIGSFTHRLPVHRLMCEFERDTYQGCRLFWTGFYWLALTHLQRDLSYDDLRRFKMPSNSASADSSLIRRYLSNSHVAGLIMPDDSILDTNYRTRADIDEILWGECRFAIRMLADVATRNFSVGYLRLYAGDDYLVDYRSMDIILGGLRIEVLDLRLTEDRFVGLIKTTDFFRLTTIQGLKELKLELWMPSDRLPKARNRYPLWTAGITHLSGCSYYEVDYHTHQSITRRVDRQLQSIAHRIVTICEKFERGEIAETAEHFALRTNPTGRITYGFNNENAIASGLEVASEERGTLQYLRWDVFRFRNAATGEWLTACVGQEPSEDFDSVVYLHILKGERLPDASFAYFRNALI